MSNDIGRGIATVGMWGAVAYATGVEPPAGVFVGMFAMLATILIW